MIELRAKLLSKRYVRERWVEPVGTMDEPCDADDEGAEEILRNPDGPEAATQLEAMQAALDSIECEASKRPINYEAAISFIQRTARASLQQSQGE